MTSLIFGAIYAGHHVFVTHKREKSRQKNYQRWEGLRDEYDEQRQISRQSRSLDLQRGDNYDNDRPILTLRDQQEANDARTSWRPQESWDAVPAQTSRKEAFAEADDDNRRASVEVTSSTGLRPLASLPKQATGSTWDAGLPQPLRVTRRNFDDYEYKPSSLGRSASVRNSPSGSTPARTPPRSPPMARTSPTPSPLASDARSSQSQEHRSVSMPAAPAVQVIENVNPGGRMAELIELGYQPRTSTAAAAAATTPSYVSPQQNPTSFAAPQIAPFAPAPYRSNNPFETAPAATQTNPDGSMQEWWNRP